VPSVSVKRSLLNVGHANARARKQIGARKTINSRSEEICYCGQRDASPITVKVEKRKDKKKESNSFVPLDAIERAT
jgi:hypothetical protein